MALLGYYCLNLLNYFLFQRVQKSTKGFTVFILILTNKKGLILEVEVRLGKNNHEWTIDVAQNIF